MIIHLAARPSRLSIAQVKEVIKELSKYHFDLDFEVHYFMSKGDIDKKRSLRELEKTDFFTDTIDKFILTKKKYVGIHSAKDLPDPLPKGLKVVAFTKGVDQRDSIVLNKGASFFSLKKNSVIATSSVRREEMIKQLRDDLKFADIRGAIEERLNILNQRKIDGIVIAEAAIKRLNLEHLNRFTLPFKTVKGQGQLAIVANENDDLMEKVFAQINYGLIN